MAHKKELHSMKFISSITSDLKEENPELVLLKKFKETKAIL